MQLSVIDNMDDVNIKLGCISWLLPLLTILFIGLKLTNYITWSWWWVLAPIWIPISIFILAILIFLIIYLIWDRV